MLNAKIAQMAIARKNSVVAEVYANIAEGACPHGNFDRGYDMEQACWACEMGDSLTPEQMGYQAARAVISAARQITLGQYLLNCAEVYGDNPELFARYAIQAVHIHLDDK